jgi:hypothetical protein
LAIAETLTSGKTEPVSAFEESVMRTMEKDHAIQSVIGGYLDISANMPQRAEVNYEYALNAARFCLAYIVIERGYRSIWLPYYGCHTLAKAVSRTGTEIRYYTISEQFTPNIDADAANTPLLFINYYGLMTTKCAEIAKTYTTVIIDNAQAFYAPPTEGSDCIYSPRKFFALPDGGFIIPGFSLKSPALETDISYARMEHLVRRVDCGAEDAYSVSLANRDALAASPMKNMSKLTQLMLSQVDTRYAAEKRKENWNVLQSELSRFNEFSFTIKNNDVPLFYPFLFKSNSLRRKMNERKIFTPIYWPGMEDFAPDTSFDMYLCKYMHPLTIDQRYSTEDMHTIASVIKNIIR